jgi:hypothetical protein
MSGAHDIKNLVDEVFSDSAPPHALDYERRGAAQPGPSTRDIVEFALMGLVYFLLPLLLLFVLQVLFPWL